MVLQKGMKAPEGAGNTFRCRHHIMRDAPSHPQMLESGMLCRMADWARSCRADDVLGAALLFALVPALLCLGGW